ncbi:hypothetical protein LINGRAPRIM_LOCUS297 [Linum grandiflorum]
MLGGSDLRNLVSLFLQGFLWYVWKERNNRVFRNKDSSWKTINNQIGHCVCEWGYSFGLVNSMGAKRWLRRCLVYEPP